MLHIHELRENPEYAILTQPWHSTYEGEEQEHIGLDSIVQRRDSPMQRPRSKRYHELKETGNKLSRLSVSSIGGITRADGVARSRPLGSPKVLTEGDLQRCLLWADIMCGSRKVTEFGSVLTPE